MTNEDPRPGPLAVCGDCRQPYRDHTGFWPRTNARACSAFRQLQESELTDAERATIKPATESDDPRDPDNPNLCRAYHPDYGVRCSKGYGHSNDHVHEGDDGNGVAWKRLPWIPADADRVPFRPHERETLEAAARNALDLCDRIRAERDALRGDLDAVNRMKVDLIDQRDGARERVGYLEGRLERVRADLRETRDSRDELAQTLATTRDELAEVRRCARHTADRMEAELAEVRRQRDTAEALAERRGEALDRLEADASQDTEEPTAEDRPTPGEVPTEEGRFYWAPGPRDTEIRCGAQIAWHGRMHDCNLPDGHNGPHEQDETPRMVWR